MKFLLVTYNDSDGVGQTVVNLNDNLNNLGHQSKVILLSKSTQAKNIIKLERDLIKRFIYFPFEFLKSEHQKNCFFINCFAAAPAPAAQPTCQGQVECSAKPRMSEIITPPMLH